MSEVEATLQEDRVAESFLARTWAEYRQACRVERQFGSAEPMGSRYPQARLQPGAGQVERVWRTITTPW